MPQKNFRSLFRGSKIRLSFLFRLAKIYISQLLHQVGIDSSKGTLQKGKSRRRFFCPHAKKESPAALVMLQGFS
jgi:hypothetical protein